MLKPISSIYLLAHYSISSGLAMQDQIIVAAWPKGFDIIVSKWHQLNGAAAANSPVRAMLPIGKLADLRSNIPPKLPNFSDHCPRKSRGLCAKLPCVHFGSPSPQTFSHKWPTCIGFSSCCWHVLPLGGRTTGPILTITVFCLRDVAGTSRSMNGQYYNELPLQRTPPRLFLVH
jgi:hypothetical protein